MEYEISELKKELQDENAIGFSNGHISLDPTFLEETQTISNQKPNGVERHFNYLKS